MWRLQKRRVRAKRASTVTKHYLEHKELTRSLILERLEYFNQHYQFTFNRVAIKNQRRCWGSCSSLKNLNPKDDIEQWLLNDAKILISKII